MNAAIAALAAGIAFVWAVLVGDEILEDEEDRRK